MKTKNSLKCYKDSNKLKKKKNACYVLFEKNTFLFMLVIQLFEFFIVAYSFRTIFFIVLLCTICYVESVLVLTNNVSQFFLSIRTRAVAIREKKLNS